MIEMRETSLMNKEVVIDILSSDEEMSLMKDEILNCPHKIVRIDGILRWEVEEGFFESIPDFNAYIMNFLNQGISKNDEVYRDTYRRLGFSLYKYWETFYWDMNNEDFEDYSYIK